MTTLRAINNPFLKSIILTTLNTGSRNYSQRTKVLSKIYRPNPLRDLVLGNERFEFRQKMYLFSRYKILSF